MTSEREGWKRDFVLVTAFHLVLAVACIAMGVRIDAQPARGCWDCFWQSIPASLLVTRPTESLWYLHAQPPLFNLCGAALLLIAPTRQLALLHGLHVVLGALTSGMVYGIIRRVAGRRRAALAAALLLATNPTMLLFEAYPLYVVTTAFLATLAVFALCLRESAGDVALLVSAGSIATLTLLWSTYHLAFAVVWAVLVATVATRRLRTLAVALLLVAPVGGWYAKNQALYGFFGASSWFGQSLWRAVSARYTPEQLQTLAPVAGLDKKLISIPPFSLPSRYVALGYAARSPIPLLDGDTRHNLNIVAISRAYGASAGRLLVHDPAHYAGNVARSYLAFTRPSPSLQAHVGANAARIPLLVVPWSQIQGAAIAALIGVPCGPLLAIALPVLFVAHGVRAVRSPRGVTDHISSEPVVPLALVLCGYTLAAGCLFEYGETARFKVTIEPLLGALLAAPLVALDRR
ncbi:MAG: hypothetical protein U0166_24960 [Acidobacteriota bacterium]